MRAVRDHFTYLIRRAWEGATSCMTWFKVDDSFYDHPKVFDAPDCALALWVRAGCWSARNLTDGFVPANLPARLCDDPDTAVRELVDRGLWRRAKGGLQFHDWTTYQPSGDDVRSLRKKRADAGRRGGQAKAAKQIASKPLASASPDAKQNAAPSRPVPKGRTADVDGQSAGDQSVRAGARAREATRYLAHRYPGLTDQEVIHIITQVEARSPTPIKHLVKYMTGMNEGDLADIVAAVMDHHTRTAVPAEPPPAAEDSPPGDDQDDATEAFRADPNAAFLAAKARISRKPGTA